ncbi:hypothetical protein GCM10009664_64690 [Kitasatospora gansuensis]
MIVSELTAITQTDVTRSGSAAGTESAPRARAGGAAGHWNSRPTSLDTVALEVPWTRKR